MTFLSRIVLSLVMFGWSMSTCVLANPVNTEKWIVHQAKVPAHTARTIASAIHQQARAKHLPVSLLVGVMQVESSFKVKAKSRSGALGLMQVMPRLHCRKVRPCNLFNIHTAIQVGGSVLNDCRQKATTRKKALQCYTGYRSHQLTRYVQQVETHMADYKQYVLGHLSLNDISER